MNFKPRMQHHHKKKTSKAKKLENRARKVPESTTRWRGGENKANVKGSGREEEVRDRGRKKETTSKLSFRRRSDDETEKKITQTMGT